MADESVVTPIESPSILTSVKKILGVAEDDTSFDPELITLINGVLSSLCQIGIGLDLVAGFSITGSKETWEDFVGASKIMNLVKPYVALKVRIIFDPPTNSSVLESMKETIREYEFRLSIIYERKEEVVQ